MKLALGTVQFGLPYGVANKSGQVTEDTAKRILEHAREADIDTLDTAIDYGDSEQCLGNVGVECWSVVTKLPAVPEECPDVIDWVNEQINGSLSRLGLNHITSLMLHRPRQLIESVGQELWSAMQTLKDKGIIEKIGFSIYEPTGLDQVWENFQPDIIQAPYNILDQRLKTSGWLQKLHEHGVEVHVRSVFLQGLLLMSKEQRPKKFSHWSTMWAAWDQWLVEQKFTPLEACLGFALAEPAIDRVVVGVDSLSQLEQILDSLTKEPSQIPHELIVTDQNLLNPSNWNNL
jgi:aryl-alcohol dehydrogenase-like predicted oxidoreductase